MNDLRSFVEAIVKQTVVEVINPQQLLAVAKEVHISQAKLTDWIN